MESMNKLERREAALKSKRPGRLSADDLSLFKLQRLSGLMEKQNSLIAELITKPVKLDSDTIENLIKEQTTVLAAVLERIERLIEDQNDEVFSRVEDVLRQILVKLPAPAQPEPERSRSMPAPRSRPTPKPKETPAAPQPVEQIKVEPVAQPAPEPKKRSWFDRIFEL